MTRVLLAALSAPSPNPTPRSASVTLSVPAAGSVTVEVLGALGRRVGSLHDGVAPAGDPHLAIDGADWPDGLYLIRAAGAGGAVTRPLVR